MTDEDYMRQALIEARAAARRGEVPVGAVLVVQKSGEIIARTGNAPIALCDPSAHAEILALRDGGYRLGSYRLGGAGADKLTLFVTLEPCTMCAGAISFARVNRLVYGASDPKGGAVENGVQFFNAPTCHHRIEVSSGVLEEECREILTGFFKAKRKSSR